MMHGLSERLERGHIANVRFLMDELQRYLRNNSVTYLPHYHQLSQREMTSARP